MYRETDCCSDDSRSRSGQSSRDVGYPSSPRYADHCFWISWSSSREFGVVTNCRTKQETIRSQERSFHNVFQSCSWHGRRHHSAPRGYGIRWKLRPCGYRDSSFHVYGYRPVSFTLLVLMEWKLIMLMVNRYTCGVAKLNTLLSSSEERASTYARTLSNIRQCYTGVLLSTLCILCGASGVGILSLQGYKEITPAGICLIKKTH